MCRCETAAGVPRSVSKCFVRLAPYSTYSVYIVCVYVSGWPVFIAGRLSVVQQQQEE